MFIQDTIYQILSELAGEFYGRRDKNIWLTFPWDTVYTCIKVHTYIYCHILPTKTTPNTILDINHLSMQSTSCCAAKAGRWALSNIIHNLLSYRYIPRYGRFGHDHGPDKTFRTVASTNHSLSNDLSSSYGNTTGHKLGTLLSTPSASCRNSASTAMRHYCIHTRGQLIVTQASMPIVLALP